MKIFYQNKILMNVLKNIFYYFNDYNDLLLNPYNIHLHILILYTIIIIIILYKYFLD